MDDNSNGFSNGDPESSRDSSTADSTNGYDSTGGDEESRGPNVAPDSSGDNGEASSDDDVPLAERAGKLASGPAVKPEPDSSDEDDIPLAARAAALKPKSETKSASNGRSQTTKRSYKDDSESDGDYKPDVNKKKRSSTTSAKKESKPKRASTSKESSSPTKRVKKEVKEDDTVWKWWEEEKREDGVKWKTLEHNGPLFAPPYERLPSSVRFKYDGKVLHLSETAEEVMGFYAKMLDHDYTAKATFNTNFIKDWRKVMNKEERELITDLSKCDFREVSEYYKEVSERNKNRTKEEKADIKKTKDAEIEKHGFAFMDNYKQKIGNFRIEPPGLFRGRGDHPKMGRLKRRTMPEDVIINCSKGAKVPPPPEGHKWREVRHDNTVTWLASWTENIAGQNKYIMLNPSSKIKGQKDYEKYEKARELKGKVEDIRRVYTQDFKSNEMRVRQRAVALYFIDKLALRAGNEKDSEDSADTVGCCSLRYEHITLSEKEAKDGSTAYKVNFDFLGKDSIRYQNTVTVEKRVYKNVKRFMENKKAGDDLFDRVDTSSLNQHLQSIMPGLTAKVFRTFNASFTLQQQLNKAMEQSKGMSLAEKVLAYNRANREVALLCNHQRAAPKTFEASMEKLNEKIKAKKAEVKEAKKEAEGRRKGAEAEKAQRKYARLKEQLDKMRLNRTDKEENKEIALGTSKLNYLDPRISVAWCKKYEVNLEKVYSKTQREKFRWAIDMIMSGDEDFQF